MFNLFYPNFNFAHKYDERPIKHTEFADHFHVIYEIFLFVQGEAEFIIENKRYKINPGDLLFVLPGLHHNINPNPLIPYERYVIKLPEYEIPQELLPIIKKKDGSHHTESTIIPSLFARLDHHVENYHGVDLCGLLKSAVKEILYYSCSESRPYEFEIYNENMIEVINYINENIAQKFTLLDLCKRFHYSKSYICKEFQQCMNVPIMQYVRTKKILLAEALIHSGIKPMEAFEQSGFSDYSTFYRAYKKLLQKTPSLKSQ